MVFSATSNVLNHLAAKLSDLVILCPNCHRAIHRTGKEILSVENFRNKFLKQNS